MVEQPQLPRSLSEADILNAYVSTLPQGALDTSADSNIGKLLRVKANTKSRVIDRMQAGVEDMNPGSARAEMALVDGEATPDGYLEAWERAVFDGDECYVQPDTVELRRAVLIAALGSGGALTLQQLIDRVQSLTSPRPSSVDECFTSRFDVEADLELDDEGCHILCDGNEITVSVQSQDEDRVDCLLRRILPIQAEYRVEVV